MANAEGIGGGVGFFCTEFPRISASRRSDDCLETEGWHIRSPSLIDEDGACDDEANDAEAEEEVTESTR